jgi:signal peptide peptidase SppA
MSLDDKEPRLEQSDFDRFDYEYAATLKADWPRIWRAGGNIRGNEAFQYWTKYRDGDRGDGVLKWVKEREAWAARHFEDGKQFKDGGSPNMSNIAGIIAQIKWGVVGTLGEKRMKAIVNEVKDKQKERATAEATNMSKLATVIASMRSEPWLLLPDVHAEILKMLEARGPAANYDDGEDEDEIEAPRPYYPDYEVVGNVAVVHIHGVIMANLGPLAAMLGAADTARVSRALDEVDARPDVRGIVLHMDSPGGRVTGTPELADKVAEISARKRVIAYTDNMLASAAYWIAAGASAIYASASSTVGSVGVYVPFIDQSKAYEEAGVKVDIIKSGKTPYKAAGFQGTSLTEEQRDDMQSQVDFLYDLFAGFVTSRRRVRGDALQGQTFFGAQAVKTGLIDSIASFDQAIQDAGR